MSRNCGGKIAVNNSIMKVLEKYFLSQEAVSTVYLFGSSAKGYIRKSSDIDIAVLFRRNLKPIERFNMTIKFALDLENLIGKPVDVVDLESTDPFFTHQAMLSRVIIVDKDIKRRVNFEVEQRRLFFDMQRFYELYYGLAITRLKEKALNG